MIDAPLNVRLKNLKTGELVEAVIEPVVAKDFALIKKSKDRFDKFDWSNQKKKEVYKLRLKEDDLIVGLLCIIDHQDPGVDAIEIELLEASNENIGKGKTYDQIGGCLIAFACRESFKRGHGGCVFLTPKTSLINHYANKYGFKYEPISIPGRPNGFMVHYEEGARKMITAYL
ncbi:hypothetical protein [Chitinophaga sp. LS1]|uniref:hypothetical protein n=1 Tax=Chitinophaga sp. LS1 TaxID=3051176 RepID=UPI002AAB92DD|nr:hypothetical protein [Chitinophaga sp. LS1]WPV66383.1 hypothetical protein QQL36_31810 [Chitinophaga sp. LS1]